MIPHIAEKLKDKGYDGPLLSMWREWLVSKGASPNLPLQEQTREWLKGEGFEGHTVQEDFFLYLRSLGLKGSFSDMIKHWDMS